MLLPNKHYLQYCLLVVIPQHYDDITHGIVSDKGGKNSWESPDFFKKIKDFTVFSMFFEDHMPK